MSANNHTGLNYETLVPAEQTAILDWLLYTMDGTQRRKLMERFPIQYNEMAERDIMNVVLT